MGPIGPQVGWGGSQGIPGVWAELVRYPPVSRLFLAGAGGVPFAIYNKWKENARNDSGRAPEERRMSEDERG